MRSWRVAEVDAKRSFRHLVNTVLLIAAIVISIATRASGLDVHREVSFDISRQRADQALIEFAEQADVTFMFPFEVSQNRTANRLVGKYAVDNAIEILLRGTGLRAEFSVDGVLTVSSDTPPSPADNADERNSTMTTRTKPTTPFLARVAGVVTSIFSLSAAAQDASPTQQVETVVVTARFKEEAAQDVGVSIAAYGQKAIERAGMELVQDIVLRTPGVALINGGPNANDINIRGVTNSVPAGDGLHPLVTVFLDDVVVGAKDFNMFDFNRVEVLRGPQPTYFGEGSVGGTLRYFSEDPHLGPGVVGKVSAGIRSITGGDGLSYRVDSATSLTLIPEVLGVRLVGFYEDDAGFIDAPLLRKKDINGYKNAGGRAIVLYRPNDRFSARLAAHMARLDYVAGSGISVSHDLTRVDTSNLVSDQSAIAPANDDYDIYTAKLHYKFDHLTVESVSGYSRFGYNSNGEEVGNTVGLRLYLERNYGITGIDTRIDNNYLAEDRTFTQELRFISSLDGPLNFTGGLYLKDSRFRQVNGLRGPVMTKLTQPPTDLLEDVKLGTQTNQVSGFLELTAAVTDRARLIGGARYVHENLTTSLQTSRSIRFIRVGDNGYPVFEIQDDKELLAGYGLGSSFDFKLRQILPRVGFEYDLTSRALLYGNAARGLRNGGLNPILAAATAAADPQTGAIDKAAFFESLRYSQDRVDTFEVGAKTRWLNDTLTVNGSVYYTDYKEPQVLVGVPYRKVENAPTIDILGVEMETAWTINTHWSTYMGASFIASEFTNGRKLMRIVGSPDDSQDQRKANRPDDSPAITFDTGVDFNYPVFGGALSMITHSDFSYVSMREGSVQNFPSTRLGSMHIWNTRLGLQGERWTAYAYVNNILNDLELQSAFTPANAASLDEAGHLQGTLAAASVNRPRTVGLTVNFKY